MAGILQLMQGSAPGTPGTSMEVIWTSNSGTDANGANQANRIFAKDPGGNIYQLTASDRPNLIRNSGFWFAQRQAPASATTYSSTAGRAISADGWGITNENASATYARVDTSGAMQAGLQGRFYGEFLKITSTGKLCVSQVIEGVDAQALRNRTVRLQAWMKGAGGATPTIKFGLLELNAGTVDTIPATFISAFNGGGTNPTFGASLGFLTAATPTPGDNVSITANVAAAALTANWQRFGFTVNVSSSCRNLIAVFFSDQQLAATTGFDLSQVSLTDGYEVQDWTPFSYEQEFSRVRRFYTKSFPVDTAPAQNAGANTGEAKGMAGKAGAVANAGFVFARFPVALRTAGGVTLFNPNAANALMRNATGAADMGATSATANSAEDIMVNATGVAATAVGDQVSIHFTSDAEL